MANNYEQSTVNPTLPKILFTELELLTLVALGMQHEPSNDYHLYFYSEDPSWGNNIDVKQKMLNDKSNFVVKQYLDYIEANDKVPNPDGTLTFNFNIEEINDDCHCQDCELTIETIFQSILKKKDCVENEVVIMGAFTSDKLRMDEFGGFVTRITPDLVQTESSNSALDKMRNPKNRVVIHIIGEEVDEVVTEGEIDLEAVSINYDTDPISREHYGRDTDAMIVNIPQNGVIETAYCKRLKVNPSKINIDQLYDDLTILENSCSIPKDNSGGGSDD